MARKQERQEQAVGEKGQAKRGRQHAPQRDPLHIRMTSAERCALSRVAARFALSRGAAVRLLVAQEDARGAQADAVHAAEPPEELDIASKFAFGAHLWSVATNSA